MLEGLQARIFLAKSRVLKTIDPELSNEFAMAANCEAYSIGVEHHDIQIGQLICDEPDLEIHFFDGADLGAILHRVGIDFSPRHLICE
jgi:hypothetical protein